MRIHLTMIAASLILAVGACTSGGRAPSPPEAQVPQPSGASCSLGEDGPPLDVRGRADGLYGVEGGSVGEATLAVFERMQLRETGVDPDSGKRWLHLHLSPEDGAALERFTSGAPPRKIAVVVDGRLAAVHKVRSALSSPELQVSCCDARACDRWLARLARAGQ